MTSRHPRLAVWRGYDLLRKLVGRFVRPIFKVSVLAILRRDLDEPLPEIETAVPVEVRVASRREVLDEAATLPQPPDSSLPARFERYLSNGYVCFIARVDGQPAGYIWAQYRPGPDWFYFVDLGENEVHCTDAYTTPAFRGKNIHAALLRGLLLFSADKGCRHAYSVVGLTNRRSPKAHRRLGWARAGRAVSGLWPGGPFIRITGSTHPWRRVRPGDERGA